ncbi:hypothetical protein BDP81DRAFT_439324 [Colletotrichum phormii]|uniref:Secreted protein n=1 Tax=Colletotrichum phormii TaxID=359342 RepID=A0AAI9ZHA8_9PEZI|nr:uncharacterized protein BDP81DRAFT_439324 [Colletotrichum phormii]KAK1623334.1 hypothetical protein BDP81DRAFT_439324 [Colletotrichum phormii]
MVTLFCSSFSVVGMCLALLSHLQGWIEEVGPWRVTLGGMDEMCRVCMYVCVLSRDVSKAVGRCRIMNVGYCTHFEPFRALSSVMCNPQKVSRKPTFCEV